MICVSCEHHKAEWKGTIEKLDGVTVVMNPVEPMWDDKIIDFEEDLSIGEETGKKFLMFHESIDVAVDSKRNIYVLDIDNHRVIKFNKQGDFLWETGRKGQGPGEFQSDLSNYGYSIKITPSEDFAVKDDRLIHFFKNNGDFQKTLKIDRRIWDFDILPDNRFLLSLTLINQIGCSAAFYSSKGEFLSEYPDKYIYGSLNTRNMSALCGARYSVHKGKIYVSIPGPYEIREYDLAGRPLRIIKRDFKLESPFVKVINEGRGIHDSNLSGPCYLSKDGMIVNLVTLVNVKEMRKRKFGEREITIPILDIKKFLDFFNEEGQFLGTYSLKDRELRFIDNEGDFYFSEKNPFPRIIRARLTITEMD